MPEVGTWEIDPSHQSFEFVARHLMHKGTTRPVTVDVEFLGAATDPWGNQKIGFSGLVPEVNREDWGLTWNAALETGGFLLSSKVRLEIEAELVKN